LVMKSFASMASVRSLWKCSNAKLLKRFWPILDRNHVTYLKL
jgi:hypothetical protein